MNNKFSRREVLELGVVSAALAAAAAAGPLPANEGAEQTQPLRTYNRYGEDLEKHLMLRTSPIAVKLPEKESDIPGGAVRPYRDRGYHIARCRAFALSRREGACSYCFSSTMVAPFPPCSGGAAPNRST
jgi:hypothetical protein